MKKLIVFLTIIFNIIALNFTYVNAETIDTPDMSGIYNTGGTSKIFSGMGQVLNIVLIIGVATLTITLLIMGIKLMLASPEEKASIKEKATPYVIGSIIFFSASALVKIVALFASAIS